MALPEMMTRLSTGRLLVAFSSFYLLVTICQIILLPEHDDFKSPLWMEKAAAEPDSTSLHDGIEGGPNTNDAERPQQENVDKNDPFFEKDKIFEILRAMNVDPYSIDNTTWSQVPPWSDIVKVWGDRPLVYGVESCARFREQVPAKQRRLAVGGIFSTGTNLMAQLLQHNCGIPERIEWLGRRRGHGMEWQVPWGKHNPFRYRGKHSVKDFLNDKHGAKLEDYMPVVSIRDPYDWMRSMCRHPYTLRWEHKDQCPAMVDDRSGKIKAVSAGFGADKNRVPFDSIAGVWNEWYGEYFHEKKVPNIMVRFEDIVFYSKEVTKIVCECVGGELMQPNKVPSDKEESIGDFHYVVGSAITGPGHGKNHRNGVVDSWIKYSKPRKEQLATFSQSDLDYSAKVLDKEMVGFFNYKMMADVK